MGTKIHSITQLKLFQKNNILKMTPTIFSMIQRVFKHVRGATLTSVSKPWIVKPVISEWSGLLVPKTTAQITFINPNLSPSITPFSKLFNQLNLSHSSRTPFLRVPSEIGILNTYTFPKISEVK